MGYFQEDSLFLLILGPSPSTFIWDTVDEQCVFSHLMLVSYHIDKK